MENHWILWFHFLLTMRLWGAWSVPVKKLPQYQTLSDTLTSMLALDEITTQMSLSSSFSKEITTNAVFAAVDSTTDGQISFVADSDLTEKITNHSWKQGDYKEAKGQAIAETATAVTLLENKYFSSQRNGLTLETTQMDSMVTSIKDLSSVSSDTLPSKRNDMIVGVLHNDNTLKTTQKYSMVTSEKDLSSVSSDNATSTDSVGNTVSNQEPDSETFPSSPVDPTSDTDLMTSQKPVNTNNGDTNSDKKTDDNPKNLSKWLLIIIFSVICFLVIVTLIILVRKKRRSRSQNFSTRVKKGESKDVWAGQVPQMTEGKVVGAADGMENGTGMPLLEAKGEQEMTTFAIGEKNAESDENEEKLLLGGTNKETSVEEKEEKTESPVSQEEPMPNGQSEIKQDEVDGAQDDQFPPLPPLEQEPMANEDKTI